MKSEGLTPAQLAERNAEYVTEISRLEKERSALAAENAGLKHAMAVTLEHVSVTDAGQAGVAAMIINDALHHSETPATDAFLAEVRAQGVDMARNAMIDFVDGEVGPNKNVPGLIRGAEICVSIAEQLRKGGNQ
ncbi:TPA: hypothetical protein ACQZAR_004150 [Escherichia coli]